MIAYSSLAQLGLITLGVFANNDPRPRRRGAADGQPRALPACSCSPAWSSGARRPESTRPRRDGARAPRARNRADGDRDHRARRPVDMFAGEFLILAGVFQEGWAWGVIGAIAIVLAAMYMLRMISAVLHRDPGPAVTDRARPASRGARSRRAARPDPARALGLPGLDVRPRSPVTRPHRR